MAGGLGAAYARLHGGLRHGQRPLPAPAGDAGDVGHVQRRPFVALLWHAAFRGRLRYRPGVSPAGFFVRAQRLAGRGEEGLPLLLAAYQFGGAADCLAAPCLHVPQPRARLLRGRGDLFLQFLFDLRERAGAGQRGLRLEGDLRFQTPARQPLGLRAGRRRRYRVSDPPFRTEFPRALLLRLFGHRPQPQ